MGVDWGGATAWKVRKQGEFVVAYHWVDVNDGHGEQPAMVIWPARKPLGCVPYCLPLANAWQYARSDGYPTPELATGCARALTVMGMALGRFTPHKLADVILDGIEDLVKMPPREAFERQLAEQQKPTVIGEMAFKSDGKVVAERELTLPDAAEMVENVRVH